MDLGSLCRTFQNRFDPSVRAAGSAHPSVILGNGLNMLGKAIPSPSPAPGRSVRGGLAADHDSGLTPGRFVQVFRCVRPGGNAGRYEECGQALDTDGTFCGGRHRREQEGTAPGGNKEKSGAPQSGVRAAEVITARSLAELLPQVTRLTSDPVAPRKSERVLDTHGTNRRRCDSHVCTQCTKCSLHYTALLHVCSDL